MVPGTAYSLPEGAMRMNGALAAAVMALVLSASFLLPMPDNHGRILGLPSVCPFYEMTGLPCPGCGLTRSFVCFAHGHLHDAIQWNALGPPMWLFFAFLLGRSVLSIISGKPVMPFDRRLVHACSLAALTVFISFGIGRIVLLTLEHRRF
jgi:hypothetical protein